jgi:hypothetical protein
MASARQLAEAQAHTRRRLERAFVTGAPPGRTTEPPSTGRALLAGLALAVLLLAGAAVLSVLRG